MKMRAHPLQAATLVAAAVLCALVSNAFASRERQMKLRGYYPNATKVPPREEAAAQPVPAPKPLPVTSSQLPVVITTTSTQPPVTTTTPKTTTQAPASGKPQPATPPPIEKDPLAKFAPHEKQPYIEIAYDDVKTLHDHGVLF